METFLIKAAQLIVAFAILVIIHEFGHYIFSRIFGVKVEKFYLFFNPWFTLYKYKPKKPAPKPGEEEKMTWRDTEYGIGWVPLGGYCKIAGMIDESMDTEQMKQPAKPWEFRSKPAWQRLLIMVGGVLFNFILAIIIYTGIVFAWGEKYIPFRNATEGMMYSETAHKVGFVDGDIPLAADGKELTYYSGDELLKMLDAKVVTVLRNKCDTVNINIPDGFIFTANKEAEEGNLFMAYRLPVVISDLQPGMGAVKAGLMKSDSIVSINGVSTPSFDIFKAELDKNPDKDVTIGFVRNGKPMESKVAVDAAGKIGIMLTPLTDIYRTVTREYSIFASIPRGIELGVEKLTSYVSQMKYVFTREGAKNLGGFGAIGNIFPESWNWEQFWSITAFLSVILAFMNILPIPALDGGHVLFLLVEIITRRQPSEKFLEYAQMAGMAFLFALLLFANGNDIYRFFFK
ncbi:MAG: RIP metalloprotease RseP [Muribaculaceae bacterium]|nr:RIP metalloprotease RseP [Muribaculaceae bacterium]